MLTASCTPMQQTMYPVPVVHSFCKLLTEHTSTGHCVQHRTPEKATLPASMDLIICREMLTVSEKLKKDSGISCEGEKQGQKVAHISGRVLPEKTS